MQEVRLPRYESGLKLKLQIIVRLAGTKLPVNLGDPVSTLKEQRVVLEIKEPFRRVSFRALSYDYHFLAQVTSTYGWNGVG